MHITKDLESREVDLVEQLNSPSLIQQITINPNYVACVKQMAFFAFTWHSYPLLYSTNARRPKRVF